MPFGCVGCSAGSAVATTGGRRERHLARSIATLRVRASSHGSRGPLSGSNDEQERQARTRASWTASSASAGSTTTLRARASRFVRYAASAARSPSSVHSPAQPPGRQLVVPDACRPGDDGLVHGIDHGRADRPRESVTTAHACLGGCLSAAPVGPWAGGRGPAGQAGRTGGARGRRGARRPGAGLHRPRDGRARDREDQPRAHLPDRGLEPGPRARRRLRGPVHPTTPRASARRGPRHERPAGRGAARSRGPGLALRRRGRGAGRAPLPHGARHRRRTLGRRSHAGRTALPRARVSTRSQQSS